MTDRHEPEYPLEPSEADLDDENLDAQEPVISLGESAEHLAFAELAALRFNLREWQDRARDMERERDRAQDDLKTFIAKFNEVVAERDRNAIAYSACREAAAQHRWLVHGDAGESK